MSRLLTLLENAEAKSPNPSEWGEWLEPIEPGSKGTSDILWHAMHNLGHNDWFKGIDPQTVYAEIDRIIAEYRLDPGHAMEYAVKNYTTFVKLNEEGAVDDLGNDIDVASRAADRTAAAATLPPGVVEISVADFNRNVMGSPMDILRVFESPTHYVMESEDLSTDNEGAVLYQAAMKGSDLRDGDAWEPFEGSPTIQGAIDAAYRVYPDPDDDDEV